MISISAAVSIVLYLIIGALVFGLLWYLICFIGKKMPPGAGSLFISVGQIVLMILAVLVLIGLLLSMVNGQPLFRA